MEICMDDTPRLAPIDTPPTLRARFMSFMMRRQLGRVILPARVIYNRVPLMWNVAWSWTMLQMRGLKISEELALLIHTRVALQNGCAFCADIAMAQAYQAKLGMEKFTALSDWEPATCFSERERAVLRYVDEINATLEVGDPTFEELRKHLDEREVAEVTVMNALENYYNRINLPLRIGPDGLLEIQRTRGAKAA